jgi:hypothetical protein
MIIRIEPALPCTDYVTRSSGSEPTLCGEPAATGVISPSGGDAWELIPVCPLHLLEATRTTDGLASTLTPTLVRPAGRN